MNCCRQSKNTLFLLSLALSGALATVLVSCAGAPTPAPVVGPGLSGNEPPTLQITQPTADVTADQGANFLIQWTDSDPDDNAKITFSLINTESNLAIVLVDRVDENDSIGPDSFTVSTSLIPIGTYNLRGVIDDQVNTAVTIFSETTSANLTQRTVIRIVEPGRGQQTVPPVISVTEPAFNQSVAQDDILRVSVQPSAFVSSAALPFDPDSAITLFVLLDVDLDPDNDDPSNPDPNQIKIIVLQERTVEAGSFEAINFDIPIDLTTIPPRSNGEPYFIRVTADDLTNPRVHQYAVGTISVSQLAAGVVDLFDVGRAISGVRFYGFNPGSQLGSSMSTLTDFDADGVDDFILAAQFGNPRSFGQIGEAYAIYGQNRTRFGGSIGVNSTGQAFSGVILEAPPVRIAKIPDANARTDGITSVNFMTDLTGDGRPEILVGMQHVHGAFDPMDYDPSDETIDTDNQDDTVNVTIRQGNASFNVNDDGNETINNFYRGVSDSTLSTEFATSQLSSQNEISWLDDGAGKQEWALIKFENVLQEIPDNPADIDISTVTAMLDVRVFGVNAAGAVLHELFVDFDNPSLNSFGTPTGGLVGDPTANYFEDPNGTQGGFGTITADDPGVKTVDISPLVQRLIDGELSVPSDDDLRLIIVPTAGNNGEIQASVRSSEFSTEVDRPTLRISYTRRGIAGALDCFPDDVVNNVTDSGDEPIGDTQFYAGGMVVMLNSQNRDNLGAVNPIRLESTVVSMELIGVQAGFILDSGGVNNEAGAIFARADNSNAAPLVGESSQTGRISGARFHPGGFDFVDARLLNQGARDGLFGQRVARLGDLNADGLEEIIVSAPTNELYVDGLFQRFGFSGTQVRSSIFRGSIVVFPGRNYNSNTNREKSSDSTGTSFTPFIDQWQHGPDFGSCNPGIARHYDVPADTFEVFAEDIEDFLGGAVSAGDFNQDGLDDILCGAPLNDRSTTLIDSGAVYVLYGRNVTGDFRLRDADNPLRRTPMLRIRGVKNGDKIGQSVDSGLDVNGDRVEDIFIASGSADFGSIRRTTCAQDFDGDGAITDSDINQILFDGCTNVAHVFSDESCKAFDYNNDAVVNADDEEVFRCLLTGGSNCCDTVVDNGFVSVIFGGVFVDGDRTINQIATTDLPGAVFFGSGVGHRAGTSVSSAGDFNQDGFGDLLITAPGEVRIDTTGRERLGVVYLIFGGPHLENTTWNLAQVASDDLPGIVFLSPYVKGRPNEAGPVSVASLGDINNDGFDDIAIGNPLADFIDLSFPQGPEATDAELGRRRDAGDVYIVYGNNFGRNRELPK